MDGEGYRPQGPLLEGATGEVAFPGPAQPWLDRRRYIAKQLLMLLTGKVQVQMKQQNEPKEEV